MFFVSSPKLNDMLLVGGSYGLFLLTVYSEIGCMNCMAIEGEGRGN